MCKNYSMFRRSSKPSMPELDSVMQTWWDGSQETTMGLYKPHAVIIDGHIRYSSTPDLPQEYIDGINERRIDRGLDPLSTGTVEDRSFALRSPSNLEVIGVMASFALDGARNLLRK